MDERLKHNETGPAESESALNNVVRPAPEKKEHARAKRLDAEISREQIKRIHELAPAPSKKAMQQDKDSASRANLEYVTDTLAKTLDSIRRNLSPPDQRFSKIMHNPVISNVSEVAAKTLARPYAILSGGLVACIGSALYMYFTRHLGYQYNFFVPILLFFVGLIVSIAVEVLYKLVQRSAKRSG